VSPDRDTRAGLRDLDRHASWREVYHAVGADPDQHEEVGDVS
jgi:hypothetical protein